MRTDTHKRSVVVVSEEERLHPDDEQIEQYALGMLGSEATPDFEQHVLMCHACQDLVAEMDASVQGIQAEARQVRVEEMLRQGKTGRTSTC